MSRNSSASRSIHIFSESAMKCIQCQKNLVIDSAIWITPICSVCDPINGFDLAPISYIHSYFDEVKQIAETIDYYKIERMVEMLIDVRAHNRRVFILGVGGSAANASHMVNDLRKLCMIEAYAPTDNVSELSARTNDEGFHTVFKEYLITSRFNTGDMVFVLSVGGGAMKQKVSVNIINAVEHAIYVGGKVAGVVGKKNGYMADLPATQATVLVIPEIAPTRITPHSEAFQSVVWHCMVSHPKLQYKETKW